MNPSQPELTPEPKPVPTPPQPLAAPTAEHPKHEMNAGLIVLQWLCYSLWAWTLVALCTLVSTALTYFLIGDGGYSYGFVPYDLAALVCLLPVAFIVDTLYRRREPATKHGFAAVVMVLNAVIIFLWTIGGFISAVIALLMLFLHPDERKTTAIWLISSVTVSILNALLFARILNFSKLRFFNKLFPLIVALIAIVSIILGAAGPLRHDYVTRDDQRIETNIGTLQSEIETYASNNRALPETAGQIDFQDYDKDAKKLLDDKMVEYRLVRQAKVLADTTIDGDTSYDSGTYDQAESEGKYQLCAKFTNAKGTGNKSSDNTYLDTSNHPAGNVCYDLTYAVY